MVEAVQQFQDILLDSLVFFKENDCFFVKSKEKKSLCDV